MKNPIKKPYLEHEIIYQQMQKKGVKSWDLRDPKRRAEIDVNDKKFIISILSQPWAPKKGKVLELGCGTGPILRLICKKGFSGSGIDISKTAISLAKQQSKGLNIKYIFGDICDDLSKKPNSFDMVIDGHCLHCITDKQDRRQAFRNIYRLLKPGGLFMVMTMCAPLDRKSFNRMYPEQKLVNGIIYCPWDKSSEYTGIKTISGKRHIPTRYLGHWKGILTELASAGFNLQQFYYAYPSKEKDICSILNVAALKLNDNK